VVSYVPAFLHIHVAKACLLEKINMITASYISPELQALDAEAKNAGLIFFNEIGLDPGIDHLQAIKLIHDIKSKNGK
jgi:saccharopine dehydrogenase-like NADP-dependent oxidoreductase